jgi:uncharacterized protein with von Willebrand factor type A (vWA) domain
MTDEQEPDISRDEFLSMLGEKPKGDRMEGDELIDGPGAVKIEVSKTALKLDQWNIRMGKQLLKENERMRQAIGKDSVAEAADFHALAFEPEPELAENCEDKHRAQYVQALLENPNYQAVHTETMCDDVASEMAAVGFTEQWAVYIKEVNERKPQEGDPNGGGGGGGGGKQDLKDRLAAARAANQACKNAAKDVNDLRDAQQGFGLEQGTGAQLSKDKLKAAFQRVRKSDRLKKVCERAGRFRRFAQSRQRIKTKHGIDDVVGVVIDGDLGRVLPHELAKIGDEDLELDFLRRLVERQVFCREWHGVTTKAKGPIVLWVDESGSMEGERIADAKAIALAMAWIAQHQKRYCCLIGFAGTNQVRPLIIKPGENKGAELMDWVEQFFNGGTDIPIEWTMKEWEKLGCPKGKTDLVCITDGITCVDESTGARFQAWKQAEQVSLTTIVIGEPHIGELEKYSEKSFLAAALGLEEDSVESIMSI